MNTMKKYGCKVCEGKAKKLLDWVEEAVNRYPSIVEVKCSNSHKIPNVPMLGLN
jgi:hypothetical protein